MEPPPDAVPAVIDYEAKYRELQAKRKEEEAKRKEAEAKNEKSEAKIKEEEAKRKEEEAKYRELQAKRKEEEAKYRELQAKIKELERRGYATSKCQWLRQVLPKLRVSYDVTNAGSSTPGRHDIFAPKFVRQWESFPEEATQYENEVYEGRSDRSLLSRKIFDLFEKLEVGNNASAMFPMEMVLLHLKHETWTVHAEWTSVVVETVEYPILPFEMKPPSSFCGKDNEGINLVESYEDSFGEKYWHHRECVSQLMAYMVTLDVIYGVLTSAEFTYFVRRVPNDDKNYGGVEISMPIKFNSEGPTLLEALFYILNKSAEAAARSDKQYPFQRPVDPNRNKDAANDDSVERVAKKPRTFQTGTRKSPRLQSRAVDYRELKDTAASNLHLEGRPYFSGGWSGKIGIGSINGQKVCVKIAQKDTKEAEALLKEITAYKMLKRYWGRYVPELVKYGTTVNGSLVFIATQFINGSEIWRRAPSEAEWRAAEEALNAIHSSGLLHGDIHGGNIMIVQGGVQFIDFGFSKFVTSEADCSKELNELKRILQKKKCISTVTQS